MSRLATECRRLYLLADTADPVQALMDETGQVRAAVLEVARPADWQALSAVWRGVQADLGLPEPAVAVNGRDGLQLWFSLAQPVPAARAQAWLDGLRRRYLPELPLARLGLLPRPATDGPSPAWDQAAAVLRQQPQGDCWPAFVAPDLAAVFADTPWLDLPPGTEGQADLLSRMRAIPSASFEALLAEWQAPEAGVPSTAAHLPPEPSPTGTAPAAPARPPAPAAPTAALPAAQAASEAATQARRFLLTVMHDEAAPLALRIDAARALLTGGATG